MYSVVKYQCLSTYLSKIKPSHARRLYFSNRSLSAPMSDQVKIRIQRSKLPIIFWNLKSEISNLIMVEMTGIEPATPWMQIRCSPSWATSPCLFGISDFKSALRNPKSAIKVVAGTGFEPATFGLWAQRATWLLHPALKWWAWVDSNYRPHAYQACALTNWATGPRA